MEEGGVSQLERRGYGGLGFDQGDGEDTAVPVEQVKERLWGWSSHDRRGDHRSSSLEVEDGAAEPAGHRDGQRILIWGGG